MSLSSGDASRLAERTVDLQDIELHPDLSYREHLVVVIETTERKTRNKSIKFLKVQWSHHSDKEATWESEDHLCSEFPEFFQSEISGRDILVVWESL